MAEATEAGITDNEARYEYAKFMRNNLASGGHNGSGSGSGGVSEGFHRIGGEGFTSTIKDVSHYREQPMVFSDGSSLDNKYTGEGREESENKGFWKKRLGHKYAFSD